MHCSSENSFFVKGSYYGKGLGEVVLSDLQCDGDELDIGECPGTWTSSTIDHTHDIGVSCDGGIWSYMPFPFMVFN